MGQTLNEPLRGAQDELGEKLVGTTDGPGSTDICGGH